MDERTYGDAVYNNEASWSDSRTTVPRPAREARGRLWTALRLFDNKSAGLIRIPGFHIAT